MRRPSREGTDWRALAVEGVRLVDVSRHSRKLKRGTHRGNAFRIALRGERIEDDIDRVSERIEALVRFAGGAET